MDNSGLIDKIINSAEITEADGSLLSFVETHVISLIYKRGNYRHELEGFEDPTIDVSIEFSYDESPFIIDLQFRRCTSVNMNNFNSDNSIYSLSLSIEKRGFYADMVTPLPPYISVEIGTAEYSFNKETGCHSEQTVFTSFKCFEMEVLGKRKVTDISYA